MIESGTSLESTQQQEKTPRVSIGLPVYNGARFIRKAIDSVLAQDFADFELIICDNASTDDTFQICEEYAAQDARIRLSRNETNLGANPNFTRVFLAARGEYFKWFAHDDWLEPSLLSKSVEVLDRDPSVSICYPWTRIFTEDGEFSFDFEEKIDVTGDDPAQRFLNVLNNMEQVFVVFGLMRVSQMQMTTLMKPISGGDRPFVAEMALHGKFHLIPEYLYANRITHSARSQRRGKNKVIWWDTSNSRSYLPRRPALIKEYLRIIWNFELPLRTKVYLTFRTLWRFTKVRKKTLRHLVAKDPLMPFREAKYALGALVGKARRRSSQR